MNINKGLCITEKLVRKNPQLFLYEPLYTIPEKPKWKEFLKDINQIRVKNYIE